MSRERGSSIISVLIWQTSAIWIWRQYLSIRKHRLLLRFGRIELRIMMGGVVPIKIDNMMDSCLIMTSSTEEVRLHYKGYNDYCIARASGI